MPQKPNYRFERAERERLQAERKAKKELRRAERRGEGDRPAEESAATPAPQAPDKE